MIIYIVHFNHHATSFSDVNGAISHFAFAFQFRPLANIWLEVIIKGEEKP